MCYCKTRPRSHLVMGDVPDITWQKITIGGAGGVVNGKAGKKKTMALSLSSQYSQNISRVVAVLSRLPGDCAKPINLYPTRTTPRHSACSTGHVKTMGFIKFVGIVQYLTPLILFKNCTA